MDAIDRCTIVQLLADTGREAGPARVRLVLDGVLQEGETAEAIEVIGARLRREGWRLVSGDRIHSTSEIGTSTQRAFVLTYCRAYL